MKYILLFLISFSAYAGNEHHNDTVYNQTTIKEMNSGTALGIANAQHQFDMSTHSLQGSVAMGHYDGADALSFALGKRFDKILLNGSVGLEDGKVGYGVGLNFRF